MDGTLTPSPSEMLEKMKIPVEAITNLTDEELEQVVELHVKAYSGSEYYEHALARDWSLLPGRARASYRAALLGGFLYGVRAPEGSVKSGQIVSLGIFFQPGTGVFATEAQRRLGFDEWLASLRPELRTWYTTVLPNHRKTVVDPMYTDEERSKRWWCSGLITDPEFRGKGYAKAVINAALEKVYENDGFLGLATLASLNGPVYEAMGFTVRGTYKLPTLLGEIELTLYDKSRSV